MRRDVVWREVNAGESLRVCEVGRVLVVQILRLRVVFPFLCEMGRKRWVDGVLFAEGNARGERVFMSMRSLGVFIPNTVRCGPSFTFIIVRVRTF